MDEVLYYPIYQGDSKSFVKALAAVGEKDTSLIHRRKIGVANGVTSYTGTNSQNTYLLELLKSGYLIEA